MPTESAHKRIFDEQDRGKRIWFAVILGALSAFGPLSMDMYLPSLPLLTRDLQTSTSLAQLSIAACLIGMAVGQLFFGPLSDRYGRRGPLLIGLMCYGAASFLCAVTPSIGWLLLFRLIQGLAGGAGLVISRAIARDLYSGIRLTKFFSMLMAVNGVFPIIAPMIGGFVLRFTSWHGVFVLLGLIGGMLFLIALFGLPETLHRDRRIVGGARASVSALGGLLRDRMFISYAAVQGLITGAMFCYISGSSFVLQEQFGVSPQGFSLIFALNGFGIVLMTQLAGILSGRIGELRVLQGGTVIAAMGSVALFAGLFLHPQQLFAVLVPLFFIVSMVGIVGTTAFSLAMQSQGKAAGSASAVVGLMMNLFGAVLSPIVGISGSGTYAPMALLILLCDVGALLIFMLIIKKHTD